MAQDCGKRIEFVAEDGMRVCSDTLQRTERRETGAEILILKKDAVSNGNGVLF